MNPLFLYVSLSSLIVVGLPFAFFWWDIFNLKQRSEKDSNDTDEVH